jgi:hypothetical protein
MLVMRPNTVDHRPTQGWRRKRKGTFLEDFKLEETAPRDSGFAMPVYNVRVLDERSHKATLAGIQH